ncbi:hypothetical protein EV421DRAFT_1898161 [Armillaria borealis]|uniref:Uncharacterized protein n=1 Tax=Armillaria borealis TaxID=47425 RepID=A0AA39K124_9AGAR|nr:hypothetical protein EV421DRAFT_1898161 [Armillaria borealis]
MAQEDTKEAPKADSNAEDFKVSEQAEEREKETHLPGELSSDQASQELPVEGTDRAAEGDSVSKEDKDSEEQQTQDEPDDPLKPPMPPSLVYKGRPLGPTAGGAGHKPHPKPDMPKFFSQIWSLAKRTAIDTRDDFRKLISGQGSTEDPLKPSSTIDSEEFAPRGKEGKKTGSSVPKNSGKNSTSTSGKQKVAGPGKKSAPPNPPQNPQTHPAASTPRRV